MKQRPSGQSGGFCFCLFGAFANCGFGEGFAFICALRFTTSPVIAQIYMRFFSLRSQRDATLPKGEGKLGSLLFWT
ncbi:MAG: hypothetical protein IJU56_08995 [Clostridia bacterium]|nr:hypothetical protein [Clostridia bacterium]